MTKHSNETMISALTNNIEDKPNRVLQVETPQQLRKRRKIRTLPVSVSTILTILLLWMYNDNTITVQSFVITHTPITTTRIRQISLKNSPIVKEHRRVVLFGKKSADGKKRRPKQSQQPQTSPPQESSSPQPLRVTNQINISVKRQIKFVQMKKELEKNNGTSFRAKNVRRTKYRKVVDEEAEEAACQIRKHRAGEPTWDVILNATSTSPLVIVDGYNVIYKINRLKKLMKKGNTKQARDGLIHDLEELRAIKGWRIEVVFDGGGNVGAKPLGDNVRGVDDVTQETTQSKKKVTKNGVRVVYSGYGNSADSYIEGRCASAKSVTGGKTTSRFIVASDDGMIRVAATSAGALLMSSQRIIDEIKAIRNAALYRVEVAVAKMNGDDVRHEKLRGATIFRSGQILIEDKRNRKKNKEKEMKKVENKRKNAQEIMEGTKIMPSWAIVPNQTKQ